MPPESIDVYIAIQVLNTEDERFSSVLSLDESSFLVKYYSWLRKVLPEGTCY